MVELKVESANSKLVNQLAENNKITNEKIEKSLNYDELSPEEKEAVEEFNKKIDITDSTVVLQYGAAAQNKVSEFSDTILKDVKTKNAGDTGELLANLVGQIKSFDSEVGKKPKGLAKLFHSVKKELDTLTARYNKIEGNINTIEKGLEKNKIQLLKDIEVFDTLYQKNLEYFKEISLYIIAGERKIDELKNTVLPKLRELATQTNDQIDVQKVSDLENQINRFEKKIHDLKTTRVISIQMAPQIRLLQNNDAELVEKIQSSITNTIPLWKNQMVLALGISNAKKALKEQQAVSNLTNEMLKQNSATLKTGSLDIAKESERAIIDIETLKQTNKDIIEALDGIIKIHEEGKLKRAQAEEELQNIEQELKNKIITINVDKK